MTSATDRLLQAVERPPGDGLPGRRQSVGQIMRSARARLALWISPSPSLVPSGRLVRAVDDLSVSREYEAIYGNMPVHGLGKASSLVPVAQSVEGANDSRRSAFANCRLLVEESPHRLATIQFHDVDVIVSLQGVVKKSRAAGALVLPDPAVENPSRTARGIPPPGSADRGFVQNEQPPRRRKPAEQEPR